MCAIPICMKFPTGEARPSMDLCGGSKCGSFLIMACLTHTQIDFGLVDGKGYAIKPIHFGKDCKTVSENIYEVYTSLNPGYKYGLLKRKSKTI